MVKKVGQKIGKKIGKKNWCFQNFFRKRNFHSVPYVRKTFVRVSHVISTHIVLLYKRSSRAIKLCEIFETLNFCQYPKKICQKAHFVDHVAKRQYLEIVYISRKTFWIRTDAPTWGRGHFLPGSKKCHSIFLRIPIIYCFILEYIKALLTLW